VRQPDTTLAQRLLGWTPQVPVEDGLRRTIAWFREQDERHAFSAPPLAPETTEQILHG
jgi:dTDP-glucose 4,6-dehydratase